MSNLDTGAIVARLRDVLLSAAGNLRTITAGTYEGEAAADLSDDELASRALEAPRLRVQVGPPTRAPESPPQPGNVLIYDLPVTVVVIRHVDPEANDSDVTWDAVQAAGADDADVLQQALTWPGNVDAGGIVSSCLRWLGSEETRTQFAQGGARQQPGIYETTHRFTAKVVIDNAAT